MSRSILVRGLSGVFLTALSISTACSSSDDAPTTTRGGDAGGGSSNGGASAGAQANGGKAGKSGGVSGAGSGAHAGMGGGSSAGAHSGGAGSVAGAAGAGLVAGAGPEAGSGGDDGVNPCAACSSGVCLPGGQCVACLPSDDHCPAGQYCSADDTCVAGCKNGDSCASGVCGESHDCQNCVSDQECAGAHVCGAQQCAPACSAQQQGGTAGCGTGLTCCSLHCVDTINDQQHCGDCGTACSDSQFCGKSGCVVSQFSSLCQVGKVVVILDGQEGDDPTGRALGQALVNHCGVPPTVREVSQSVADAVNPADGRPVSGSDELMLIAGGSFFQHAAGYLVTKKIAPVMNVGTQDNYEIHDSKSGALIASEPISGVSDSHGLFAVQFMREPTSGSLIVNAYGFTVGGTAAATYYFTDVLAPDLASATKAWYVGNWADKNADLKPDVDELTIIASGG